MVLEQGMSSIIYCCNKSAIEWMFHACRICEHWFYYVVQSCLSATEKSLV